MPQARQDTVNSWKAEGVSNREIARRLGINEKAVRKLVKRLGWKERSAEQMTMPFEGADPKLSASGERRADGALADANPALDPGDAGGREGADLKLSASGERRADGALADANLTLDPGDASGREGADPKLSASAPDQDRAPSSMDLDPADRAGDRLLARLGLLDDAAPVFGAATQVPGLDALLAIPALVDSGVLSIAREIYSSIGPSFYGLRTTLVTLLLMALLRIKRPEGLKERSPRQLGQILGLDRAPEVKTLRSKLARLAAHGRAGDFGRALARHRVVARGHAMGFLYVDGHVRAYHGAREIPKTHLARMRIAMPATTDYYLREEFALDALVDFGTEPADTTRDVPNPERSKINAELRKANAHLEQLQAHYGLTALENQEDLRPTIRGFKIANAESAARVRAAMARVTDLETQRATIPTRVPVHEVVDADAIKLSVERKHLTDILKMLAYQAEGELLRLLSPYYRRTEQEGRTLIHSALAASGDIQVTDAELLVSIDPLSYPHKTQALAAVCEQLNLTSTHFPGTDLRMRFARVRLFRNRSKPFILKGLMSAERVRMRISRGLWPPGVDRPSIFASSGTHWASFPEIGGAPHARVEC